MISYFSPSIFFFKYYYDFSRKGIDMSVHKARLLHRATICPSWSITLIRQVAVHLVRQAPPSLKALHSCKTTTFLAYNTQVDAGAYCIAQDHHCHDHQKTGDEFMGEVFSLAFLVSQQEAEGHPRGHPP